MKRASDKKQDAKVVASGVHQHESALHKGEPKTKLKFRRGGIVAGNIPKPSLAKRARGGAMKMNLPKFVHADGEAAQQVEKYKRGGWIKGAVKHPGAFTASANKAGKSVHQYAEEKKSAPGTTGRRARLALTFEKMAHRKG